MKNVTIAIVFIILVWFYLEGKKPKISPVKTQQAVSWLKNYYKDYPIGGGWAVVDITANKNNIIISVIIPNSQAAGIIKSDFKTQKRVLSSSICPNQYEDIWSILDENHVLVAEVTAIGAGVFSDVYCKE